MPQTYPAIPSTEQLVNSRQPLLDRDDANKSAFSGTAFPTSSLLVGMVCYRTDENRLYRLKDTTPTWVLEMDFSGSAGKSPNADALDGYNSSAGTTPSTVPVRNASGQLPGDITGNAATATKLATARTLSLSGDATGSQTFDGSANAAITVTLANTGVTAGTYNAANVTVDAKGRITAISANASLVASFNGRTGAVSLTSSDVTTALGFTPFSAAGGTINGNTTINGRLNVGESSNSASYVVMYDDASTNGLKYIHANSNLLGFLGGNSAWLMYVNASGQMNTAAYGWLHDYFFSTVSNPAATDNGNLVFGSVVITGVSLTDEGSNIKLNRTTRTYNCNCVCTNCDCGTCP